MSDQEKRLSKRYKAIYGFYEQHGDAYGVKRITGVTFVPAKLGFTLDPDTGRLVGGDGDNLVVPMQGVWFLSFREAKKFTVAYWEAQVARDKQALSSVRKATPGDFDEK
jgi:hypothetical protein